MKIYTKTGDGGETSLIGNVRVPKDHLRVDTYGALDETTSAMGLARSLAISQRTKETLHSVQEQLINLSAEVAAASGDIARRLKNRISMADIQGLETEIDWLGDHKLQTKGWTIPGTCPSSAALDMARTVSRRAERLLVGLNREEPLRGEVLQYVNRLSDLLYALARYEEWEHVLKEVKDGVNKELTATQPTPGQPLELSFQIAHEICIAAFAKADALGIPVVVAIFDQTGTLQFLARQKGALPVSLQLAQDKAYTAYAVRKPTHEIYAAIQPGEPLYGLQHVNTMPLTVVGGGFPIVADGQIIGSLGISGGTVAEDVAIGSTALEKAAHLIKENSAD